MGYRSDSIAVSRDMGPLREGSSHTERGGILKMLWTPNLLCSLGVADFQPCWSQESIIYSETLSPRRGNGSTQKSEEDKRATANVQNGLVFFILFSFILFYSLLFSFILFYSLWTKTVVKPLNSPKKSWRKNSEKLWKSVKMCGKVPKSAKKCRDDFAL